jgi:SAM-dependent methyltransferase
MDEEIDPTGQFYANNAQTYADKGVRDENLWLKGFMGFLPFGARVLELGCGAGRESALMLARGFDVTASDGTPELAAIAAKFCVLMISILIRRSMAYLPMPVCCMRAGANCQGF